jgi:hypothetical protein
MPPAMAPTTANGIAIMKSTLGLNARPNESFNAAFQPGQANNAAGLAVMTMSTKAIASFLNIFLLVYPLTRTPTHTRFSKALRRVRVEVR